MRSFPLRLILAVALTGWAYSISPFASAETPDEKAFDHSLFDSIIQESVKEGVVDYGAISARYKDLQSYLESLTKAEYEGLPREGKVAFAINAYNAHCINGVLNAGKIASVHDVWFFFKRTKFVLGGKEMSLDGLENDILRKMGEPRIHFAIVCASKSCPKLRSHAYKAATLNEDLNRQARDFLADASKNSLDTKERILYLSRIFNWFKEDFIKDKSSVLDFIKPYLPEEERDFLEKHQVTVKFGEYDWDLNGHF